MPHTIGLTFHWGRKPLNFGFISHSLMHICVISPKLISYYLLLTSSNHHNVINIGNLCYFFFFFVEGIDNQDPFKWSLLLGLSGNWTFDCRQQDEGEPWEHGCQVTMLPELPIMSWVLSDPPSDCAQQQPIITWKCYLYMWSGPSRS